MSGGIVACPRSSCASLGCTPFESNSVMSLNMLIETPGGFDYTGTECSTWMRETGFQETYVEHLVGPDSMVVGVK